jgi:type IV pilus assembly protein PilA
MLARIRKAREEREGGFTLIELLVVIIIIGILAAIAIPVFLNQRKKGYDAQSKSDLRNLATLEETYLTDNPTTYGTLAQLQGTGYDFKKSANSGTITVTVSTNQGFTLQADNTANSGKKWCYDSTGVAGTGVYSC